jgi:hypothetical protein
LYFSTNTIKVIKARRMRWVGLVAHTQMRSAYRLLVGEPEGKRPLGRPRSGLEDDLEWILEKQSGKVWACFIWLRTGTGGRLL